MMRQEIASARIRLISVERDVKNLKAALHEVERLLNKADKDGDGLSLTDNNRLDMAENTICVIERRLGIY